MTQEIQTNNTWTGNNGETKSLTKFWILLNQLNQLTQSYPDVYLTPITHLYNHNSTYKYATKIYLEAKLNKISNVQVDFLESFLQDLHSLGKKFKCDFVQDGYWYEKVSDEDRQPAWDEKFLLAKQAHNTAPVIQ